MRLPAIPFLLGFVHIYLASAKALLSVFKSSVVEGNSYNVSWLSDTNYYLDLLLVHETTSGGWVGVETLFQNRTSQVPDDSYQWVVDTNLTAGCCYGLWLQSTPPDGNFTEGYADITDWFDIKFQNGSEGVSNSSSPTSTVSNLVTVGSSSKAWLAGAVIGPIAAILVVILGFFLLRKRKQKQSRLSEGDFASELNEKPQLEDTEIPRGEFASQDIKELGTGTQRNELEGKVAAHELGPHHEPAELEGSALQSSVMARSEAAQRSDPI